MKESINKTLRKYESKSSKKALYHLWSSFPVVLLLFPINYFFASNEFILILIFGIIMQSLFMIRLFMILHDCGHQSFFENRKLNLWTGRCIGFIMLVPFDLWNLIHNKHHVGAGNLAERSILDVVTLTLEEYLELGRFKKWTYRIFRSAWFQLLIYQQFVFILGFRIPFSFYTRRGVKAVLLNDLLYVLLGILLFYFLDNLSYLLLSLIPVYLLAFAMGSYIFFIQHQFEEVYWSEEEDFEFSKVGIEGSSYWKLPKWANWITGNIGFHHIHHLNSGIPNYNLAFAHNEIVPRIEDRLVSFGFLSSFQLFRYKLYDKKQNIMIPFPKA